MNKYIFLLCLFFSSQLYSLNQVELNALKTNIAPRTVYLECHGHEVWSTGQAFIISEDGLLLTAKHVTEGSLFFNGYWVDSKGGEHMCEATLIAEHPIQDVALLKLDLSDDVTLPYFEFEQSPVQVNQWVYIGYFNIVENRVLLRGGRVLSYVYSNANRFSHEIHTSVSTYSGDSGGPWFQQDGKIVGVHTGSQGNHATNPVRYSFFLPYISFRDWLAEIIQ